MIEYIHDGVALQAPEDFVNASYLERSHVCNGIGPKWMFSYSGGLLMRFTKWMLDFVWFLDCTIIGNIHDWMYHTLAPLPENKTFADNTMKENAYLWVEAKSKCNLLKNMRHARFKKYLKALEEWGYKAFYDRD